jgi:hypothetical protein
MMAVYGDGTNQDDWRERELEEGPKRSSDGGRGTMILVFVKMRMLCPRDIVVLLFERRVCARIGAAG